MSGAWIWPDFKCSCGALNYLGAFGTDITIWNIYWFAQCAYIAITCWWYKILQKVRFAACFYTKVQHTLAKSFFCKDFFDAKSKSEYFPAGSYNKVGVSSGQIRPEKFEIIPSYLQQKLHCIGQKR